MQSSALKTWLGSSHLSGTSQSWVEQLYEDFLTGPNSVDTNRRSTLQQSPGTRVKPDQFHSQMCEYLRHLAKDASRCSSTISNPGTNVEQVRVLQLISAYRFRGHQRANPDPLGLWQRNRVTDLDPSFHDLTEADFQETFSVGSFASGKETMKLGELLEALKQTYCDPIDAEYMYVTSTEEKHWIQQRIKSGRATFNSEEKERFLNELTAAEGLERYLGVRFPGAKRFSLEGSGALIPILKEMIRHAGNSGTREVVLEMAHRGRLNVLVSALGKKLQDLSDEFVGKHKEHLGTGDMKYHMGFSSNFQTDSGLVHLALAFNPSHPEIASPVVIDSVCAHLDKLGKPNSNKVLPVAIHGDAAVTEQGVVQETLNMSKARGYEVGGTVRIIINNQVGFTASNSLDARSTPCCADIGKMVQAPVFHVNVDDPEAVAFVTRLALDFHNTFRRDVFIDLMYYRCHGHNEADEPSATQPLMYQKIKKHPTPHKIYTDKLEQEKMAMLEDATKVANLCHDALNAGDRVVAEWRPINMHSFTWSPYFSREWDEEYSSRVEMEHLRELAKHVSTVSETAEMQSRAAKIYGNRQTMAAGEKLLDWGGAESLAYATLVDGGISVRLSGEDSGHGIFFHRHTMIHNQSNGSTYTPLQHIHNGQGAPRVWDSVLSEGAVLASEYDYAAAEPRALTVQEARFGDFANGARVVIDQFISSDEQEWGRMCGLVVLLPHGCKGQGPKHSSTRLERYLQLYVEQNMQVCVPSTPAQVYHMLCRRALREMRHPLAVMSPKSLLRHPLTVSSLEELADGTFLPAIGEIDRLDPKGVRHVVMCSDKVYYDLLERRRKNSQHDVAAVRIKQLYPFPHKTMREVLQQFTRVRGLVWYQEEPLNQGAWYCSQHHFHGVIPFGVSLRYTGHPTSVSPAVRYISIHQKQQQGLVNDAPNVK